MKKLGLFILLVVGLIVLGILLSAAWMWLSIPRADIQSLVKGYVAIELNEEKKPIYSFVAQKPAVWVELKDMSPELKAAFVVSEDWDFYRHPGIDFEQIKKALRDYLQNGQKLRGASTISQQLAKNLFLSHDRSFVRKLQELLITMELEKTLSKDKILEIYLNIIQYGDGLYGIKNAAQFYFKNLPADLNSKEAAFLAMLLPNPVRYAQSFEDKKLTEYAEKTIRDIQEKMRVYLNKTPEEWSGEKNRPLRFEGIDPRIIITPEPRVNPRARGSNQDDDGSDFERRYREDLELQLDDAPVFDPSSLPDIDSDVDAEFSIE